MAEPFAAVTNLTTLSKKLTEVITKLGKFLQDVKGDLEIKNDVTSLNQGFMGMEIFLLDSKNNPDLIKSNLFQIWVTEVTQLATECEDVADEINLIDTECGESAFDAHDLLGSQIKDLLSDIEDILSKQSRYDLNSGASNSISKMKNEKSMELSRSASFVNNEQMVGHHDTINDLSRILKNGDSGQFFISIVGMDGLGKTTIARKLFNTLSTKHFTYHAWVCAPQEFNIQDVVMSLINSMTSSHEIPKVFASVNSMIQHLRNHLSEHRSLVVIDDVPDLEAWESLQIVFPKNSNHGSKVIITTRNENVVASNNVYVHKLRYLDDVESWILFCRKALSQGTKCPSNLKQVGIEMVAKCSGLPLAIEVLGGILFKKPLTLSEWEAVRDNLYPNDELRGKNKNKLSDIDSISSGESSYDLNADINSAISAMESLGIKLGEVLPKVRNFFRDKEDDLDIEADVVTLEKELKLIQKGFKDLEIKPDKDISLLKTWVKDVSKLAIEGEPVVDQITSLTQEETKTDLTESIRILSTQIKELLVRSKDLSTMRTHYDSKQDVGNTSVGKSEDEKFMELSRSASFDNNEQMIIHLDTINDLSAKLTNGDSGQFFISIVGMGGIGKTTIARTLFNTLSSQHFTYSVWVSVSKEYNIRDVLMLLINSLTAPSQEDQRVFASINLMIPHLRKYLSDHRCLVAIDDVRDLEIWEILQRVYPKNNNGSKVIITTRNETMVVASNNVYVHKLWCLDEHESWALFCRKALSHGTKCPSKLKQVGKQMVAKCLGLPLAIEALGAILLKKPLTLSEWEVVRYNLYTELKDFDHINKTEIEKILSAINGISSGESSYNLNADINSAISAVGSLGIKFGDVLPKLSNFIRDKVELSKIEANAVILEKELKLIQMGLKIAEIKPDKSISLLKTWMKDVHKLAIEGEAVVDQIISLTQEESMTKVFGSTRELSTQIHKFLLKSKYISNLCARYNPKHMIGHEDTIDYLLTEIMDGDSGKFVISILGMGGLGKTTLARHIYDSLPQQSFDTCAWLFVSKKFNILNLLTELIKSMTTLSEQGWKALTSTSEMEAYLHQYLTGLRFLIVIDDVWERDVWESLKRVFPNSNNGSRIIITTRNKHVAELNNAHVHKLRNLSETESWDLLRGIVLSPTRNYYLDLDHNWRIKVRKCSGLPLAIVVMARILLRKSLFLSQWENMRDELWEELWEELINDIQISEVLTLSFEDLPDHLKQCFLYVGMFPEDFEIKRSKLMLLWEAEGFMKKGEEGYVEDATKSYFEELVDRCLFIKTGGDWIDSTFLVHDVLRALAIRKAREMGFYKFYDGKRTIDISKAPSHTRLALFHPHNDIPAEYTNTSLHTFFCWEIEANIYNTALHGLIRTLPNKFQNLIVLDVIRSTKGMPNSIGDMIHLRFLGFRYISMPNNFEMPNTIGNLKALQTLSVSRGVVWIPMTVLKLTQLKHLIGDFEFLTHEIGSLLSLETLTGITGEQWSRLDTTNLVKLRGLKLWKIRKIEDIFYDNFRKLGRLQTLTLIKGTFTDELDISLEKIFELCPSISHLKTNGISFHTSLNLDRFAKNLVVVECVLDKTLSQDTISLFGRLPQLEALNLNIAWLTSTDVHVDKGFAQLRFLKIRFLTFGFVVSEDCMPLLEHLEIDDPSKFQGPARMMRLLNR